MYLGATPVATSYIGCAAGVSQCVVGPVCRSPGLRRRGRIAGADRLRSKRDRCGHSPFRWDGVLHLSPDRHRNTDAHD